MEDKRFHELCLAYKTRRARINTNGIAYVLLGSGVICAIVLALLIRQPVGWMLLLVLPITLLITYLGVTDAFYLKPVRRKIVQMIDAYLAEHVQKCDEGEYLEITYVSLPYGGTGGLVVNLGDNRLCYTYQAFLDSYIDHHDEHVLAEMVTVTNRVIGETEMRHLAQLLSHLPHNGKREIPPACTDGMPLTMRLVRSTGTYTFTCNFGGSHDEKDFQRSVQAKVIKAVFALSDDQDKDNADAR